MTAELSEWDADCLKHWGRKLVGEKRHWCYDWDFMPIDETCVAEMGGCTCFEEEEEVR